MDEQSDKLTITFDELPDDFFDYWNESDNDTGDFKEMCSLSERMRFDAVLLPVLYTLGLVLGLLGNGLVLVFLVQKRWRGGWSVADTFILHLGVADSLLLFTLPFWAAQAAQEQGWSFGTPLCKIAGAMFTLNFYCGIYLLGCISLNHYLSTIHATRMYSRRKPWMVQASCLSVWLFSLFLSIPDWIFLEALPDTRQDRVQCIQNYLGFSQSATSWRLASRLLYHIVGFLVPSAVLLFCYSSILLRLRYSSLGHEKHRAIRIILALVLLFFICWTPYNITLIMDTLHVNNTLAESCQSRTSLAKALTATSSLGYLHSSLNPVLYAFVGVKFRRHLLNILRSLGCKLKSGVRLQATESRWSSGSSKSGDTSNIISDGIGHVSRFAISGREGEEEAQRIER